VCKCISVVEFVEFVEFVGFVEFVELEGKGENADEKYTI